jgi:autotransporter translocation and assembly factor TamB
LKKGWKIVLSVGLGLLLLSLLTIGFTQTKIFRDWLRGYILTTVHESTNADLYLGDFSGSLFTGLTITGASLNLNGEEIFSADAIELSYNPLELPRRHIALGKLILTRPKIHLIRSPDGVWNFQKLPKEKTAPANPASFLMWVLELKTLEVVDGEFSLIDSTAEQSWDSSNSAINPYRFVHLSSINSMMSALLSSDDVRLTISHLRLKAPSFSTQLEEFSANLQYSKEKTSIKDLTFRSIGSELRLNGEADSLDFSEGLQARTAQSHRVDLDLDVSRLSFAEVQRFFPSFPLRSGNARLNLAVNGAIDDLQLEKFNLRTEHSELKLGGRIQNILRPMEANVDLMVSSPSIDLQEVTSLFPSFELPNMSHLQKASLSGHLKGKPDDFEVKAAADVNATGRLEVAGHFDLRGSDLQYQARFATKEFNLGSFLNNRRLESRLNVSGEIAGIGTAVKSADFTGNVSIDSSEISNVPLDNSKVSINAKNQLFRCEVSLHSNGSTLEVQSGLDLKDESTPAFDLHALFSSLDLASIFQTDKYRSSLTGSATVRGTGKDLDHASGTLDLNFQKSTFRDHRFRGTGVKLTVDQRKDTAKSIIVESPVLDARINGDFHVVPFVSLVKYEVANVLYSLKEKLPFVDSTRVTATKESATRVHGLPRLPMAVAQENQKFNFTVDVKNLAPLAIYLGEEDFNAKGEAHGSVLGNAIDLDLRADASVENFVHRGKETKVLIEEGTASVEVDHLKQEDVFDSLQNNTKIAASTFLLNGVRMSNLRASLDYFHSKGSFDVSALVDSTLTVKTNGSVSVTENGYAGVFDSLTADYRGYTWSSHAPILVTIDTSGLMLKDLEMFHRASQLSLSGGVRPSRDLALELKLKDYDLSGLRNFWSSQRENDGQRNFGGQASAEVTLTGSFAEPAFTFKATSPDLRYGAVTFGTLQVDGGYRERRAKVSLEFRLSSPTQSEKPDLLVAGSLPLDLSLSHVEDRLPDEPVDVRVEAVGFHLDLLDPFIPVFDNIEGRLYANVRLGGTMKSLSSSGSMRLEDGKFVFTPNDIKYFVSGTFEPKGEKIVISKLTIRNDPKDEEAKGLSVTGEVGLRNLSVASFDLTAQGQLLILRETARRVHTAPYGNLLIGIGENGLRYHGSIDRSNLAGTVSIKTMAVTFPPVALQSSTRPTSTFSYTVIDDTSKSPVHREIEDSFSEGLFQPTESAEVRESAPGNRQNTFDKLLAGMMANVLIETQGPTELRMIIAYSTGEELLSELSGKLFLTKDEFGTRFTGDVNVGKGSYYYFYKRFDATGKLRFTGALDNPEMDITAQYEGFRTPTHLDSLEALTSSTSKEEHVVVTLKITGTRISPKLAIAMTVDDKEWPGDVQSDAIAFILSGKFRDDLTSSERSQIATSLGTSVTSTVITGVTSSIFSGVLTDFLRSEFGGFIRQAELTYSGGNVSESADLRLTGEVGETVIRVGGRVFNDIGNANVNIQMPVGRIIGSPALEDLIIELERKVEGSNYATDERKLTNGARIYYRITF